MLLLFNVNLPDFLARFWGIISWVGAGLFLNLLFAFSVFRIRCLQIEGARKIPWYYTLAFPWYYGFWSLDKFPATRGRQPFFDFFVLPALVFVFAPLILLGIPVLWILAGVYRPATN